MLYRVNTNSTMTLTLNPDFGQVESDPADINLTAFETYFQEKRPFFLKDSDIFETPIEVFYSRRIGEKAWGAGMEIIRDSSRINPDNPESQMVMEEYTLYTDIPVIIKSAAKLTGKTESGLSYGLLGAVTTLQDSSSWAQQMIKGNNRMYLISRLKQDLFAGNSFVGMIGTVNPVDSAHTLSVDGMTNLFDNQNNFSIAAYYVNQVMDTTGAGDSFAGGLISSLMNGADIREAMVEGSVMASFCIENIAHRGLISFSEEEYTLRKKWLQSSLTT